MGMKTRKWEIAILFLVCSLTASAQDSPFTWGVKTGMTLNSGSVDIDFVDQKTRLGFLVGATVDYALTNDFYLQSGLFFMTKGAKIVIDTDVLRGEITVNQMYLQLPVTAAYKLSVNDNLKIVFNAGPYVAYGIGGKTKLGGSLDIPSLELNLSDKFNSFGDDALKRFDFGITAGVGAEFGKIAVGVNYDLGLIDIADYEKRFKIITDENINYKNHGAVFTIAYKF